MTFTATTMSPAELSERVALLAGEEAVAESGIGAKGRFPGPLYLAPPPLEIEWSDRIGDGRDGGVQCRHDLSRPPARRPRLRRQSRRVQIRHHWRTSRRAFRHRRLAGLAQHRVRVRRQRHPARHGGDPPRRLSGRARDRRRRVADARNCWCASRCFRRCRRRTIRPSAPRSRSPRTATASCWRRAPPRWCSKTSITPARAARAILGILEGYGEKSDSFHRTRSSPDGKPIVATIRKALADAGVEPRRHRLHQRPRHFDARERQDGASRRLHRVRRSASAAFRSPPTNR